jgi:hypothetical protein
MKPRLAECAVLCMALFSLTAAAQPLSTTFTYQGQLKQSSAPLDAAADLEFRLFDAPSGGTQVGNTALVNNVNVVDGLFTASVDCGSSPFNGNQRWLQVAVRSPAGSGIFTTLSPRQPMTAVPYALYALTGPGSGGPWAVSGNNVFNTNTGNVGIGTSVPQTRVHLIANQGGSTPGEGIRIQGTSAGVDNLAYLTFMNSAGTRIGYVGDGGGADNSVYLQSDSADVNLYTAVGAALTAKPNGNVGVGTFAPAAKLDVRGDIRLGLSGEYRAPAGEENLRMIRGIVTETGNRAGGTGFTVTHPSLGTYVITFTTPFVTRPVITVTEEWQPGFFADFGITEAVTASGATIKIINPRADGFILDDASFHFIAIGPR